MLYDGLVQVRKIKSTDEKNAKIGAEIIACVIEYIMHSDKNDLQIFE